MQSNLFLLKSTIYIPLSQTVVRNRNEDPMKRMLGFIIFWIAIGMTIMFFMTNNLLAMIIIITCLILGYNLFCC